MGNGFLLREDCFTNKVVDGDDSANGVIFKNGEIADIFFGHQLHAKLNGVLKSDRRQVVGHDF